MPPQYTKDQFWELYKKLPPELKKAVSSNKTSDNLYEICKKYKILSNLYEIAEYVGQTLLGVLAPTDFQSIIEKDLEIELSSAKKVSQEINRFIFYPVKATLTEIYNMDFPSIAEEKKTLSPPKNPPKHLGTDSYREGVN